MEQWDDIGAYNALLEAVGRGLDAVQALDGVAAQGQDDDVFRYVLDRRYGVRRQGEVSKALEIFQCRVEGVDGRLVAGEVNGPRVGLRRLPQGGGEGHAFFGF